MKKLLVLAALSAMVLGAKAEYYSYTIDANAISGAKAVYMMLSYRDLKDISTVAGDWEGMAKPMFLDEVTVKDLFKGDTWAANYAAIETMMYMGGAKFSENEGSFDFISDTRCQSWALMALTDATEVSPGAAYAIYYATSDLEGGAITIDSTIETGFLMTDASAVPEPTSGLLLLLGVAGLALKRKRA